MPTEPLTSAAATIQTLVKAEGFVVGEFDDHEDAHGMADAWNHAYPPADGYPDFVVDGCDGKCGYDQ